VRKKSERFALRGEVFYFHAPEGFYRSKLGGRIERSLGVDVDGTHLEYCGEGDGNGEGDGVMGCISRR
jgi:hypothetical protein